MITFKGGVVLVVGVVVLVVEVVVLVVGVVITLNGIMKYSGILKTPLTILFIIRYEVVPLTTGVILTRTSSVVLIILT